MRSLTCAVVEVVVGGRRWTVLVPEVARDDVRSTIIDRAREILQRDHGDEIPPGAEEDWRDVRRV